MTANRDSILVAGDTHGHLGTFRYLFDEAALRGIQTIVQVGDFGYRMNAHHDSTFHRDVNDLATERGIEVYWLDGNHENFDELEADVEFGSAEPFQMDSALWYLPRGATWTWNDCRFMSLGGAYSVDQEHRLPHYSWWYQELLTNGQVTRAMDRGPVDVLFSHDAPEVAWPTLNLRPFLDERDAHSRGNRLAVQAVVDAVQPNLVVHGHYHKRYAHLEHRADLPPLHIEGLAAHDGSKSWLIIEPSAWATARVAAGTQVGAESGMASGFDPRPAPTT